MMRRKGGASGDSVGSGRDRRAGPRRADPIHWSNPFRPAMNRPGQAVMSGTNEGARDYFFSGAFFSPPAGALAAGLAPPAAAGAPAAGAAAPAGGAAPGAAAAAAAASPSAGV